MVWGMIIAIGAVFVAAAAWFRPRRGIHALLVGIGALWLIWSFWSYPLLNDSSSAKGVMKRARELAKIVVEQREGLPGGILVAPARGAEQIGEFRHRCVLRRSDSARSRRRRTPSGTLD